MGVRNHFVTVQNSPDGFWEGNEPKHLITGNGFTMAYPNFGPAFSYGNLLQNANTNATISSVFSNFGTPNFEEILRVYDDSLRMIRIYEPANAALIQRVESDSLIVKDEFMSAISQVHPISASSLTVPHTTNCSNFLRNFSKIFTTNYDLFLYWIINSQNLVAQFSDGFTTQGGTPLHWNPEVNDQHLFFLHGGLHLYTDSIGDIHKIVSNFNTPIIPRLRQNILNSRYPLVILEGNSSQKMQAIRRNEYLSYCYRSLGSLTGKILVYGMSFQFDVHLLKKILESELSSIYFCLYGTGQQKQATAAQINHLILNRPTAAAPTIYFVDSTAFTVW